MAIIHGTGGIPVEADANGSLQSILYDHNGFPLTKAKGGSYNPNHGGVPISGLNDGVYRFARTDRSGGLASAKYTPFAEYFLFTAALPPAWLAPTTTMTATHAITSGSLLNASAIGTINTHVAIVGMQAVPKTQRTPILHRTRARIVKGGTNGQAEIGLATTQAPAVAIIPNGFSFQYQADGSLKPVIVFNSNVVASGIDFAASIDSTRYYTWDIIVDDNSVNFVVQDSTSGLIISDQTLNIGSDANRLGSIPYFFPFARSYVGGTANAGVATQVYVGDITVGLLDMDAGKLWSHTMAAAGKGVVVNPTVALTQLENYANSAAPVSATLSNTAAGYTTLGGQFQFAAVAGAETDYALFGFTVPTGVKLHVTDIFIDTVNTGAAAATTATLLQWFAGIDGTAVTLAANNFRKSLGFQSFAVGAAIGAQAAPLVRNFQAPLVTNSGRFFHIGLKMPVGTATASQVIRGTVSIGGYFE